MLGFQECCDAEAYNSIGYACLSGLSDCWDALRPIGAVLINALFWHWGEYSTSKLNHLLLLLLAFYLIASEFKFRSQSQSFGNAFILFFIKAFSVFALLEMMFAGLASVNLTDIAAGVFAALAMLGFMRQDVWLLSIAAVISVLIRAAYLYPMVVIVVFFLVESLLQQRKTGLWAALFFLGIAPQFWLTYTHTGVFAFLDPVTVKYWQEFHLSSNWVGYDTLIPAHGSPWKQDGLVGFSVAYQHQQWSDMLALITARINFYFSSFVPWGKVYLSSPSERIFSPIIGLCSLATLILSILYLKARAWRLALPLSLILAQSLIIIPEQRFIFVIQLFLVMFAYLYCLQSLSGLTRVIGSKDKRGNKDT